MLESGLRLYEVIWKARFAEKVAVKHGVALAEVEEVLFGQPHVRLAEKGLVEGENLYVAYGRTEAGRYVVVFFIRKRPAAALPISARDMTEAERRYFRAQKEAD